MIFLIKWLLVLNLSILTGDPFSAGGEREQEAKGKHEVASLIEKVGECRDRNPASRTYYALLKVKGKQIKNSLETAD